MFLLDVNVTHDQVTWLVTWLEEIVKCSTADWEETGIALLLQ